MKTAKQLISIMVLASMFAALSANAAESSVKEQVVNINTATAAELSFLPGIGKSKADAIIKYRSNRQFKKVEDLLRVKGIGRKTFKKMRSHLTVKGDTTAKKKIKISG